MPEAPRGEPPRASRTRRALVWLAKAPFRLAWFLLKKLGKLLWWAFRAGFQAGRRAPREPEPAPPAEAEPAKVR